MIRKAARISWFLAQAAASGAVLPWLWLTRRRALLVLTHAADVDAGGEDVQMGRLLRALEQRGDRCVEVRWIPLDRTLLRELRRGRRGFLCHAALLGLARLASFLGAGTREAWRARIALALVAALRPRALVLIDESASGQPWLKAARRLGIPSIAIQHGDFQPDDPLYGPAGVEKAARVPVDRLCVWSPWFRRRLLGISPIYTESNTVVTGRLMHAREAPVPPRAPRSQPAGMVSVLLIGEREPRFEILVEPYVRALRADRRIELQVRPHPGAAGVFPDLVRAARPLSEALARVDVAVGVRSSALLEALYVGVPAVVLLVGPQPDPGGFAREGVATSCDAPERLAELCMQLGSDAGAAAALAPGARVWEGAPGCPVQAVLAALDLEVQRSARV